MHDPSSHDPGDSTAPELLEHSHLTWTRGEASPDDPMFSQVFVILSPEPEEPAEGD